jgi:hypothetical protein
MGTIGIWCSIANRKAPSLKVSKVSIHHQEHHLLEKYKCLNLDWFFLRPIKTSILLL